MNWGKKFQTLRKWALYLALASLLFSLHIILSMDSSKSQVCQNTLNYTVLSFLKILHWWFTSMVSDHRPKTVAFFLHNSHICSVIPLHTLAFITIILPCNIHSPPLSSLSPTLLPQDPSCPIYHWAPSTIPSHHSQFAICITLANKLRQVFGEDMYGWGTTASSYCFFSSHIQ